MTDFDLSTVAPRLAAAHRERQGELRIEAMARFGKSMREVTESYRRAGERLTLALAPLARDFQRIAEIAAGLDTEEPER